MRFSPPVIYSLQTLIRFIPTQLPSVYLLFTSRPSAASLLSFLAFFSHAVDLMSPRVQELKTFRN